MKKKIICFLLFAALAIEARAQRPWQDGADYWVIGYGQIEALVHWAVVRASYDQQIAANPNDSWTATYQAYYAGRADIDARINGAIGELCNRDADFCSDVFQRYGLRWKTQQ